MSEIKNKIITISGEPASGKSTAVDELKRQYEKMGYNVEVTLVGQNYRPIVMEEYNKYLAQHPELPRKENPSLAEAQTDPGFSIIIRKYLDTWLDNRTEEYGKRISSKPAPDTVYIIDARLAWQRIPNSFAVRTTIDEKVAGERAFNDPNRGKEDSYSSVEEAIKETRERKIGEVERYKKRYGVDLTDPDNYDLVLDTTNLSVEEVARIIIEGERKYREENSEPIIRKKDGFEPID